MTASPPNDRTYKEDVRYGVGTAWNRPRTPR
jgi:hypothetical protein